MTRTLAILTLLAGTQLANATVTEWSGRTPGTDYVVRDDVHVEILTNGTFKFQALDGSGNLDVIGNITVADGVTGTVTVYIERETDNDSPGATNVGSINLTNDQGAYLTGNLAKLRINGNLATDEDIICYDVSGNIDCIDIVHDFTINNSVAVGGNMAAAHKK